MVTLTAAHKAAIERVVSPHRARFDIATRTAFSRDDGVKPALWPVTGRTLADGVVWPNTEQEIVELVHIASAEGIPLVPRGGGTAAAGGAVPANGGLVVDLSDLSGVSDSDVDDFGGGDQPTVEVRAGTRWTSLAANLAQRGLALRLYPTSAPFSTVGGWLAQGGVGMGSFAYGWFDQNVVSARIVDGRGRIYSLGGVDLDGVSEAEGTTGFISHVRLHVQPASNIYPVAAAFPTAKALAAALHLATLRELPFWSATFVRPTAARGYVALFAARASDREVAQLSLYRLIRETDARRFPVTEARRMWAARFQPLRLMRRGRTTAPAEVVVPTARLADTLNELERAMPHGMQLEGTLVRGGETVVRAYLDPEAPGSQAGLGLGFALRVIDRAARHDGRAQYTGRYFGPMANAILGARRVALLRDMRAWLDPIGIINPGKVIFGNQAVGLAVRLAVHVSH